MTTNISTGCNRRVALDFAADLGCRIKLKPGTGEMVISHSLIAPTIRINVRKKSASRTLTSYLRRLERLTNV